MNTVKLHWIQTPVNDPFTSDTYAIEDSGFSSTGNSYVHEAEEYNLPEGYSIGETKGGEVAIFNSQDKHCVLDRHNKCPRLSSPAGVVYLKKK